MSYMKEQRPGHTNNMIQANDNLRVATYKKLVLPESFAGYRTAPSVLRPPTEDWLQRSGSRHGSSRESPVLSVAALRRITELEIALSEEKKRNDNLRFQLGSLHNSVTQKGCYINDHASVFRCRPLVEGKREDLCAHTFRGTEDVSRKTEQEASKLEMQVESTRLAAAAELREAQQTIQFYTEQLGRAYDELHDLREQLRLTPALSPEFSDAATNAAQGETLDQTVTCFKSANKGLHNNEKETDERENALQLSLQQTEEERRRLIFELEMEKNRCNVLSAEFENITRRFREAECYIANETAKWENFEQLKRNLEAEKQALNEERVLLQKERQQLEDVEVAVTTEQRKLEEEKENITIQAAEVDRAWARVLAQTSELETLTHSPQQLSKTTSPVVALELLTERDGSSASVKDLQRRLSAALAVQDVLRAQLATAQKLSASTVSSPKKEERSSGRPPGRGNTRGLRKAGDANASVQQLAPPKPPTPEKDEQSYKRVAARQGDAQFSEKLPASPGRRRRRPSTDESTIGIATSCTTSKIEGPSATLSHMSETKAQASSPVLTMGSVKTRKGSKIAHSVMDSDSKCRLARQHP